MAAGAKFDIDDSAPVQIVSALHHAQIQNLGPNPVYLGGSGVTKAQGFKLFPGVSTNFALPVGTVALEAVYAICDDEQTAEVRVLTYTG